MAKIPFTKLNLKKNGEVKTIFVNEQSIEVKQYLPIADKITIIENVLRNSASDNNFANPIQVEVYLNMEIIYNYTNITFTDKQKEDITKLYDLLEENNIISLIISAIPEDEYQLLLEWTDEVIKSFYAYQNSALGIFEKISTDYKDLNFDATEISKKLTNKENLELVKDIMEMNNSLA